MRGSRWMFALGSCLLVIPALAPAADKPAPAAAGVAYPVAIVNSTGISGVDEITPFLGVVEQVNLTDDTPSDTMLTSQPVWRNKPLWKLTGLRESKINVTGPTMLTLATLAPFTIEYNEFKMEYIINVRVDGGAPDAISHRTQRSNPLYTTSVPGWTFGLPQALTVPVPAGKHVVSFQVKEAPKCPFVYGVVLRSRPPAWAIPDPSEAAVPAK